MKSGEIITNERLKGDYHLVRFHAPELCRTARAGQFVHVRIGDHLDRILRRPFSIHNTANGALSVVYKVVGTGTAALAGLQPGAVCDLLGPLGKGFGPLPPHTTPVIVAGGYGAAATYLLTHEFGEEKGYFLMGARSDGDIILDDLYREAGMDVRLATNDGSRGAKGFVTRLVEELLCENPGKRFHFYACGPHPMLMALAKLLRMHGLDGELSIDHLMCCGVGACFSCVIKVKADTAEGWRYARTCSEGPVFPLNDVWTED